MLTFFIRFIRKCNFAGVDVENEGPLIRGANCLYGTFYTQLQFCSTEKARKNTIQSRAKELLKEKIKGLKNILIDCG